MKLSEQRWAVMNQQPRPPGLLGLVLAVISWLLDTGLHWISRKIIAIHLVIFHSSGKPLFTVVVIIMWMAITQSTTYLFSDDCAITLYFAGDLVLITLFNFIGHVYHDGPFDLKRLIYWTAMWDLRLYIISSFGLFYRKSILHFAPLTWIWNVSGIAMISIICFTLSVTSLYLRPLWEWIIISNDILRLINDHLVLFWYRLLHISSRGFRALCERVERLYSAWRKTPYYSYTDLHPGQIRLLYIKRRILFFGCIHADIVIVDLVDAPPYEAISYYWGDPTPTHEMLINGCRLGITETLSSLLSGRSSLFQERLLWVDYICINQKNTPEKESQIPMMRAIYEKADRVIIWLGDKPEAPMAVAMWNNVLISCMSHDMSPSHIYDTFSSYHRLSRWHAFINLIRHPYFSRVWICQEVAVSSNAQIYHGGMYIPWESWASTVTVCMDPVMRPLFASTDGKDNKYDHWSYVQNIPIISCFSICRKEGIPLSLGAVLFLSAAFKSTNPADKIFGILGLVSESCGISVSPDYSKPVSDLYTETAKKLLLSKSNAMLVLPFAGIGYPQKLNGLPSWAPDWTQQRLGSIIGRHTPPQLAELSEKHKIVVKDFVYCAAGKSEPHITLGSTKETMNVKGIRMSTISKFGFLYESRDEFGDFTRNRAALEFLLHWHTYAKIMAQETVTTNPYKSRDEAFWRTLIGDSMRKVFPAPENVGRHYDFWLDVMRLGLEILESDASEAWVSILKKYESFIMEMVPGSDTTNIVNTASAKVTYTVGLFSEFYSQLLGVITGRRFCITDDGYMGLVPPDAEVGDLVCILFGGQTPFLLREYYEHGMDPSLSNHLYQLVGECYIQGMMNGELMSLGEEETFVLI